MLYREAYVKCLAACGNRYDLALPAVQRLVRCASVLPECRYFAMASAFWPASKGSAFLRWDMRLQQWQMQSDLTTQGTTLQLPWACAGHCSAHQPSCISPHARSMHIHWLFSG